METIRVGLTPHSTEYYHGLALFCGGGALLALLGACELWQHVVSEYRVDPFKSAFSSKLVVLMVLMGFSWFFNPLFAVSFFSYLTMGYCIGALFSEERRSQEFVRLYYALSVSCLWMFFVVLHQHYHQQESFSRFDFLGQMRIVGFDAVTVPKTTTSLFSGSGSKYIAYAQLILAWGGINDCPHNPTANCTSIILDPLHECSTTTLCPTSPSSSSSFNNRTIVQQQQQQQQPQQQQQQPQQQQQQQQQQQGCEESMDVAMERTIRCEKGRYPLVYALLDAGFDPYDPTVTATWPKSPAVFFGDCHTCEVANGSVDPNIQPLSIGASTTTAVLYGILFCVNLLLATIVCYKNNNNNNNNSYSSSTPSTPAERLHLVP